MKTSTLQIKAQHLTAAHFGRAAKVKLLHLLKNVKSTS
jgi:hypothetical protein